jgi:hypothetical protein
MARSLDGGWHVGSKLGIGAESLAHLVSQRISRVLGIGDESLALPGLPTCSQIRRLDVVLEMQSASKEEDAPLRKGRLRRQQPHWRHQSHSRQQPHRRHPNQGSQPLRDAHPNEGSRLPRQQANQGSPRMPWQQPCDGTANQHLRSKGSVTKHDDMLN